MAKRRRYASEPFGPAMLQLMDETGVTYRALASATGLSAGYVNHLVHGNRPVPSNDVIERLADALDVEPDYFQEYRIRVITERLEESPERRDGSRGRLGRRRRRRAASSSLPARRHTRNESARAGTDAA